MPERAAAILELKLEGDLGTIDNEWSGFRLTRSQLWTPEGAAVTPGEIRAIPYRRQQVIELERALVEPKQYQLL